MINLLTDKRSICQTGERFKRLAGKIYPCSSNLWNPDGSQQHFFSRVWMDWKNFMTPKPWAPWSSITLGAILTSIIPTTVASPYPVFECTCTEKIESSKLPHAGKLTALVNLWDPNLIISYFILGGGWSGELADPAGLKRDYWSDENDLGYTKLLPNQSHLKQLGWK